jgi:hypothetical protein
MGRPCGGIVVEINNKLREAQKTNIWWVVRNWVFSRESLALKKR